MNDAPVHLFVYGTLRPGDVRWPLLEPWVVDLGVDDTVPGRLFDTGLGYPAAIFGAAGVPGVAAGSSAGADARNLMDAMVIGRTYRLALETIEQALDEIDEEEDTVLGLYRRVEVQTSFGVRAWAYQYGTGLDLVPIPGGDWFTR